MTSRAFLFLGAVGLASQLSAQSWDAIGPYGGDVRALAADPSPAGLVWLGTADGRLFRSDDAGRSWQQLKPGFPLRGRSLDNIVVDAKGRVVVGYWEVAGTGGGVAWSEDGGLNFEISSGIGGESVRALAASRSDPDLWLAGSIAGAFVSRDAGRSWSRITPEEHPDLRNIESVAVDPQHPGVFYVGTWHLPWKSVDAGSTWSPIHSGMIADSDVFTLTLDPRDPSRLHATACTGIYRSSNAGSSWTKIGGIPSSSRRTRAFGHDPGNPDRLYAGTTEGVWGRAPGEAWRRLTSRTIVVNAVAVLASGVVLAGADGVGVLRSEDSGGTWHSANRGFVARAVRRVAFNRDGSEMWVGLDGGRYDGGIATRGRQSSWRESVRGLGGRTILSQLPVGGERIVGTDAGLFVSSQAGWRRIELEAAGVVRRPRVTGLERAQDGSVLVASSEGLWRGPSDATAFEHRVLGSARAVTALVSVGERTLAATPLELFASSDGGRTWARIGPGTGHPAMAFGRGEDPDLLYARSRGGLYRSRDGGAGWELVGGGLPNAEITALAVHPNGTTLYASEILRGGIHVSHDAGDSWSQLAADELADSPIVDLALDPSAPRTLVVATANAGVLVTRLDAASSATAPAASGTVKPQDSSERRPSRKPPPSS